MERSPTSTSLKSIRKRTISRKEWSIQLHTKTKSMLSLGKRIQQIGKTILRPLNINIKTTLGDKLAKLVEQIPNWSNSKMGYKEKDGQF